MSQEAVEVEDVGEAIRAGRALRSARQYLIQVAREDLRFRAVTVTDPRPLGRQILTAAGISGTADISLFGILSSGDFEDVRLNEPFDVRGRGTERFVVFETDRSYKLMLNGAEISWGRPAISGAALYALAQIGDDETLFIEVRGGTDRPIAPDDLLDLTSPGVERVISGPKPGLTFEIIVNAKLYTVSVRRVTFEQVVQLAFPGTHPPTLQFSMTYRHAVSVPHAGELGPGGFVEVKREGTTFNVTPTDKS